MQRASLVLGLAVLMVVLYPAAAVAADGSNVATPKLFQWYPDFGAALLIGAGAVFGALVVVFGSVGGVLPGTTGRATLDAEGARYEEWSKKLDAMISATSPDAEVIRSVGERVNEIRDDIRADKRSQFAVGAFLYVVLGTIVALALASDWLAAAGISGGWTGFLGSFGLKQDFAKRSEIKTEALEAVEQAFGRGPGSTPAPLPASLVEQVAIAKAV